VNMLIGVKIELFRLVINMDENVFEIGESTFEVLTWPSHIESVRKLLPLSKDHPEVNVSIILSLAAAVEGFLKGAIVETDRLLMATLKESSRPNIDKRIREEFINRAAKANWSQTMENYRLFFGVSLEEHAIPLQSINSYSSLMENQKKTLSQQYFLPIKNLFNLRNIIAHGQQIELYESLIVKVLDDGLTESEEKLEFATKSELGSYLGSNKLLMSSESKPTDQSILYSYEIVEHFKIAVAEFFNVLTGKIFLYLRHQENIDLNLLIMNSSLPNYIEGSRLHKLLFATDNCFDLNKNWVYSYE